MGASGGVSCMVKSLLISVKSLYGLCAFCLIPFICGCLAEVWILTGNKGQGDGSRFSAACARWWMSLRTRTTSWKTSPAAAQIALVRHNCVSTLFWASVSGTLTMSLSVCSSFVIQGCVCHSADTFVRSGNLFSGFFDRCHCGIDSPVLQVLEMWRRNWRLRVDTEQICCRFNYLHNIGAPVICFYIAILSIFLQLSQAQIYLQ